MSFPFFGLFTFSIVHCIIISYKSISFLMDGVYHTNLILQAGGYFALAASITYSFILTSFYADHIQNQVKTIKDILQDEYIIESGYGRSGKSEEVLTLKKLVLSHLHQWENFSGYGFFTIGKSFLTNLVANWVTYLIILIQFQMALPKPTVPE